MFTGIVEEVGTVVEARVGERSALLTVRAAAVLEGTAVGDSILTDGVCLTVAALGGDRFTADVMPETFKRTTLVEKSAGAPINLERALTLRSRLGGHLVTGHIDGVGVVRRVERRANALVVHLAAPREVTTLCVDQGSIALDGVSLTIVSAGDGELEVSLIPHTAEVTTLGALRPGSRVNLEADLIAKYVAAFLGRARPGEGLTWEKLAEAGFV
jgi:riboflavin synthase